MISQPGMRLLGLEPLLVIGTALPVIIPGAASGAVRYVREGLIRWPAVAATVPVGLVAAVVGQRAGRAGPRRRPPAAAGHRRAARPVVVPDGSGARARSRRTSRWRRPTRRRHRPASPERRRPRVGPVHVDRRGGRAAVGPARHRRRRDHGAGLRAARPHGGEGGHRHLPRVRRRLRGARHDHPRAARPHRLARRGRARRSASIPGARIGAALTIRATDRRLRVTVASFLGLTAVLYAGGELAALLG